jgi:hypothetical protein
MALEWDVRKVNNYETACYSETDEVNDKGEALVRVNTTTERIVWLTLAIGMGEITEKNYLEFATRVLMYQAVACVENKLSVNDIRGHIGLWTNVSNDSRSQFMHHMEGIVESNEARKAAMIKEIEEEA